jgi:chemotaxis methyl-accepting protein methylase
MDGTLRIAEVGCSTGKETWSLASALSLAGVDFQIDAIDANPRALEAFRKPSYAISRDQLSRQASKCGFPPECVDLLMGSRKRWVVPPAELVGRVTPLRQNVLQTPLRSKRYGAVVINNVLHHYASRPKEQQQLVANILAGLRPGGVWLCDNFFHASDAWTLHLPQHLPLQPVTAAGAKWQQSILRYKPQ